MRDRILNHILLRLTLRRIVRKSSIGTEILFELYKVRLEIVDFDSIEYMLMH